MRLRKGQHCAAVTDALVSWAPCVARLPPHPTPGWLIDVALTQAGCWPMLSQACLVIGAEVYNTLKRYRAKAWLAGWAEETHGDGPIDGPRERGNEGPRG